MGGWYLSIFGCVEWWFSEGLESLCCCGRGAEKRIGKDRIFGAMENGLKD